LEQNRLGVEESWFASTVLLFVSLIAFGLAPMSRNCFMVVAIEVVEVEVILVGNQ